MKMKLLSLFITLLSVHCFAQFSKTHYIPPLSNSDAQEPQEQLIYISCPSLTPIHFKIYELGGNIIAGTVSRNVPYVYDIGTGFDTQLLVSESGVNTVMQNKGYIVEAEDLVYVTVRLTSTPQNFQGGGLVSKGIAALGTQFRVGGFLNTGVASANDNHYTFASILATENNTTVSFDDIEPGVLLVNDFGSGNTPANVVLNAGESYVIAVSAAATDANRDGLIGTLIASDKPIAVNCGSFAGTNGTANNLDLGFDQLVSAERTGNEYIFIKGNGLDVVEKPLIVAHQDNTEVFLDGNATPFATLSAGEYLALDGSNFSANGNLFVNTSKPVFAFQGIGGTTNQANQNMYFLPPLSCQTPKSIDNIPFINEVGAITNFIGTVNLVTETGATLNFTIDGVDYTLAGLPAGIVVNGPLTVIGNANYVTYTLTGLSGNISAFSTKQLYLSYFGSSGAATYGGFYSGFTFKPEITFDTIDLAQSQCIPNVELKVSTLSGFDTFQWYFNNTPITGANSISYTPDLAPPFGTGLGPGNYYVSATLSTCNISLISDNIPVSVCPTDRDNDLAIDNIDLDNDNDGITNCTESYGNQAVNISNPASGTVAVGTYSNSFTGQITTSAIASATPFVGNADGSFISDLPAGKTNWVQYELTFAQPINIGLEYITTANPTDLLNSQAEYVVNSEVNKTITVLNPNDQLLIDTNYDGFYESGVTQFSSFEIRFRLNNAAPLPAGTGTFKFLTNQSSKISFKHKNLSDAVGNRVSLKFVATCVPRDYDHDGIIDEYDLDSDNDGIPDNIEAQGANYVAATNVDANHDGIDDAYGTGIAVNDFDTDSYPDYMDLDSDNDGIYDAIETGIPTGQVNANGTLLTATYGANGLADNLETSPDSGVLNYTLANTDSDGGNNYIDLDSDADGCNDVLEAGYIDDNHDGILDDDLPPVMLPFGLVSSTSGYTVPNQNYVTAAPIVITAQPQDQITCELQSATFTLSTNPVDGYQWQLSTDGGTVWTDLSNNATYSGVTTVSLTVSNVVPSMNGYQYRVFLSKNGNSCGLYSASATLTTYALPTVTTPVSLVQCDDDTDGISAVNLTVKNSFISANYLSETFTYYTTSAGANTEDASVQITNPVAYSTGSTTVYVRVENANGCFVTVPLNITVSVTQIPPGTLYAFFTCDDYVDAVNNDYDGIATFDFSSATASIQALLPTTGTYTIKYYKTQADALAEINEIINTTAYRNTGFPNVQDIWVRVDSDTNNDCFGLGPYIKLTVEKLPIAHPVNATNILRHCDDDQDGSYGFNTTTLESILLNGQTGVTVTYTDGAGNALPSPLPNPFVVNNQITVTARLTNTSTQAANGPCYDEVTFQFVVDDLPEAFPVTPGSLTVCDDEADPANQNGLYAFPTGTIQSQILNGQTNVLITYTLANGTVVSQLSDPFVSGTQNVVVTVSNPLNTTCTATTVLHFVVNPLPRIKLRDHAWICTDVSHPQVVLNAAITDNTPSTAYTYQWYLGGTSLVGATSYSLVATAPGIYTVDVTSAQGCTVTRTITVGPSEAPTIEDIVIVDLTENNTVEVIVSGIGHYIYSLDDEPYQESNFFSNVLMGYHTVHVMDANGCGPTAFQYIAVLGIPHYFTPNGDGINDTWNIEGISALQQTKGTVQVYDRYGKLMKEFIPASNGWDGTYNGHQAIADDYWYYIQLADGRNLRGHFALKR